MQLKHWYIEWDGPVLTYYFPTEFQEDEIAKGYMLTIGSIKNRRSREPLYFNSELNSDLDLWGDEDIVKDIHEIVKAIFWDIEGL